MVFKRICSIMNISSTILTLFLASVVFTIFGWYIPRLQRPVKLGGMPPPIYDSVSRIRMDALHQNKARDRSNYTLDEYCSSYTSKVNPHDFRSLITGEEVCSKSDPFLIIVIPSERLHTETRQTIRETWGSVSRSGVWVDGDVLPDIKLVFLFGIQPGVDSYPQLEKESREYQDIAQESFVDSYRNLSIKSIFAMRWVAEYCPQAKYILKSDEDTFVHLPRLLQLIRQLNYTKSPIGLKTNRVKPRNSGKWLVDREQYPLKKYPPYLQGQSYVLPGILAPKLFNLSEYVPLVPVEDVYLTGVLVYCAGVKHLRVSMGSRFGMTANRSRGIEKCFFHQQRRRVAAANVHKHQYTHIWRALWNNSCY